MDEQTPPEMNPPANSGDAGEANLRELALALIAPRYPDMAEGEAPQLLVGQLPPSFTSEFPQPPGSRIVGSLQSSRPTVVLDARQSADEVVDFYRERLTATGWTAQEDMPPRQGGFLHSNMLDRRFGNFYRGEDGPSLHVMTYDAPGGRTTVHLTLSPGGTVPMFEGRQRRPRMGPDMWRILPPIAPPPRSQQWPQGGNAGGDHVNSSARLKTDLDLPAVAAHYIAQLEKSGWQRHDVGENGPVAWSTWTFQDEDHELWCGLFVILKRPDVLRRYWVQVLAEWTGQQSQGSGKRTVTSAVGGVWVGSHLHTSGEGTMNPRP